MSDKWLDTTSWCSVLLGIFIIKLCAAFSLKVLGTL